MSKKSEIEKNPEKNDSINLSFNLGSKVTCHLKPQDKLDEDSTDDDLEPSHNTPSPKPKTKASNKSLTVIQKRDKIEENLKNKNRNMKNITKDQSNLRRTSRICNKSPKEKKDDSFSTFMKEFRSRMDKVDRKLDHQNDKIDLIGSRMDKIESHQKKQDKMNKKEFKTIRTEMTNANKDLEKRVTDNLKNDFGPKIQNLEIKTKEDLNKLVETQVLNLLKENKCHSKHEEDIPQDDVETTEEKSTEGEQRKPEPEKKKKKKQNKKKSKKSKQNDDEIETTTPF